jgi:hypothetical protein
VPVAEIGVSVLREDKVYPPEGGPFGLSLPANLHVTGGVRVPGGWVLYVGGAANGGEVAYVWFKPNQGQAKRIGNLWGNFAQVSPDGRRLVAFEEDGSALAVHDLPSLRRIWRQPVTEPFGPIIIAGLTGDWLVLSRPADDWRGSPAEVWNVTAPNQFLSADTPVSVWGVSRDGRVLRRVARPDGRACVDVVAAADLPQVGDAGACSPDLGSEFFYDGQLSPDGQWAVLTAFTGSGQSLYWISTTDIRAGEWRPVLMDPVIGLVKGSLWQAGHTFVVVAGSKTYRCHPDEPCQTVIVEPQSSAGVTLIPAIE